MYAIETIIGFAAALCTTASYLPQLAKALRSGSTGDLSLKMLAILGTGLALWVIYGALKGDVAIIVANAVSLAMLGTLGVCKLREASKASPSAGEA